MTLKNYYYQVQTILLNHSPLPEPDQSCPCNKNNNKYRHNFRGRITFLPIVTKGATVHIVMQMFLWRLACLKENIIIQHKSKISEVSKAADLIKECFLVHRAQRICLFTHNVDFFHKVTSIYLLFWSKMYMFLVGWGDKIKFFVTLYVLCNTN